GSAHSSEFRAYDVTAAGVHMRETMRDFDGIMSGSPVRAERLPLSPYRGLVEQEVLVLEMLVRAGPQTLPSLATVTGMKADALMRNLDRLAALGYVSKAGETF